MAQTGRATPFPAPPGLEHRSAQAAAAAEAAGSPGGSRTDAHEALRKAVLRDVDAKVTERVEELWQKGKQMLGQVQQKQQEKAEMLASEVSQCLERQQALERENEKLRQVLAQLASRLATLGPPIAGISGSSTPVANAKPGTTSPLTTAGGTSVASTSPPQGSDIMTPLHSSGGAGEGGYPPLPEVPAFPFPAQPAPLLAATPTLSLAEALGPPTAAPTVPSPLHPPMPLSLASSLPVPEAVPSYGGVFSMTLRKADQTELGLNVQTIDKVLLVEGVRPDGAVEAWNRQCALTPEKAVIRGDRIVSVNNVSYDPEKMLEQCKEKHLLKLTIVRGDVKLPELPGAPAAASAASTSLSKLTSLRADASEFVPLGAASEQ